MPHVNQKILLHIIVWLVSGILTGVANAVLASSRKQNAIKWFFLGIIAPFVSVVGLLKSGINQNTDDFFISDSAYILMRRLYAGLVSLVAFLVYAQTAQPSVPFWDCGEFIACSYSLSVPHPPGAPMFLLLGRIVSIIPLDFLAPLWGLNELTVAHKINLMSGFFNAFAVGFIFLIVSRTSNKFFIKENSAYAIAISYVAGFLGSLLTAFSFTFWNNAVEAEVYGPAMLITTMVIYIAMLWYEKREKPDSDRFLIFIAYMLYIGISIHLTVMIMLPPIFLFVILSSREKRMDPIFWFTWFVLFSVATTFNMFLFIMILGIIVSLLGFLISFSIRSADQKISWIARSFGLAFIAIFLCALAFGVSAYTIIRSSLDPPIDENDPETISAFADYMDRKQYGTESMWQLMFTRKGAFINQIGVHPRMGFWGFFEYQWSSASASVRGLIPFLISLVGLFMLAFRHKQFWILLFLALLISTLGLIIYINFSDGTKGVKIEVRDRDYFFTPGYMFWSAWIGIGFAGLLSLLNDIRKQLKISEVSTLAISAILTLVPAIPLKANWFTHDRSKNYIPHDYAYNILNSCDKNSILFTNGDNDTFPLWFLQVVLNERADVCIANLSLLNTNWYIKQLKTRTYYKYTGKTAAGRTVSGVIEADDEFDFSRKLKARKIEPQEFSIVKRTNQFGHDFVKIKMSDDRIDNELRAYRMASGEIVRVQDIMVKHLIDNSSITMNISQKEKPDSLGKTADTSYVFVPPIYFAVTVSPDNKLDYGPYLRMEGLAYRLTGTKGDHQIEPNIMKHYLFNVYQYRGLTDKTIDKDDNSLKLLQNYTTSFMTLAFDYKMKNKNKEALEVMERALSMMPYDWRVVLFTADLYGAEGKWDKLKELFDIAMAEDSANIRLIRAFADVCYQYGNNSYAFEFIKKGLDKNPDDETLFKIYLGYLIVSNRIDEAERETNAWAQRHLGDNSMRNYLESLKQQLMSQTPKPESMTSGGITVIPQSAPGAKVRVIE